MPSLLFYYLLAWVCASAEPGLSHFQVSAACGGGCPATAASSARPPCKSPSSAHQQRWAASLDSWSTLLDFLFCFSFFSSLPWPRPQAKGGILLSSDPPVVWRSDVQCVFSAGKKQTIPRRQLDHVRISPTSTPREPARRWSRPECLALVHTGREKEAWQAATKTNCRFH